ncbi:MAG: hypothetical protein D6776_09105 [Planctomycetota bacterium]|nr:MAG: hypothetical protein D6776_09105 [Planctomycetota bacterium]
MGAFRRHLVDAIAVNRDRKPRYGRRSRGRSRRFSDLLIGFEYGCLPFAWWLDRAARPWQRRGVPVLEDDLMPMDAIAPWDTPPVHRGVASPVAFDALSSSLRTYRRTIGERMRSGPDFAGLARASIALLDEIERTERTEGAHFAMTRHFVESIGLAAANAIRYRRATGGGTDPLCRRFIRVQALGLPSVLPFDRLAQPLHREGLGILVNDVPAIPARARWREIEAQGRS